MGIQIGLKQAQILGTKQVKNTGINNQNIITE